MPAAETDPTAASPSPGSSLRTAWIFAAILALGVGLRVWNLSAVHVEHFDEGVYASNLWFDDDQFARYPDRHFFAPPLLSKLEEFSQVFLGTGAWGVMLPSLALGILSIALVWRLARDWAGPRAAIAAAFLLAVSPMHVAYSRAGLTDVPMTACLIGSVWLAWKGITTRSLRTSVLAGIVTGLAWSFKYSGWLPLAIAGAALIPRWLFHVKRFGAPKRETLCWLAMTASALVVWFPSWWDLQQEGRGGYAAVAANHARYLEGFSHWRTNARRQIDNVDWYEAPSAKWIVLLGSLAGLVALWRSRGRNAAGQSEPLVSQLSGRERLLGSIFLAVLSAMYFVVYLPWFTLLYLLACLGIAERIEETLKGSDNGETALARVDAGWFAAAWFVGLTLTTPLYHPYPRLMLPELVVVWIGAGFSIEQLRMALAKRRVSRETNAPPQWRLAAWPILICRAILVLMFLPLFVWFIPEIEPAVPNWQSHQPAARTGVLEATAQLVDAAEKDAANPGPVSHILYVLAEPAAFYHANRLAADDVPIAPVANLAFADDATDMRGIPVYLIVGPHAERDAVLAEEWTGKASRFERIDSAEYEPSDLVLLDQTAPRELETLPSRPRERLTLYRLRPAGF